MKIAAEALEVRREQSRIGIIDLLGRITSASLRPAHNRVRVFDLIERIRALASPFRQ
jgi:hypothetical protein